MSNVPRARELLEHILVLCSGDQRLREIAFTAANALAELYREPIVYPVARIRSRRMTPELGHAIREFKKEHVDLAHNLIGNEFGVNAGRVSEALHRKS